MIVDIEPFAISNIGLKADIRMPDFQLGSTNGHAVCYILNENDVVLKLERVFIPDEIYAQWGQDDMFVVNYVLQQMNLIAAQE